MRNMNENIPTKALQENELITHIGDNNITGMYKIAIILVTRNHFIYLNAGYFLNNLLLNIINEIIFPNPPTK